jgi:hypothetical protein
VATSPQPANQPRRLDRDSTGHEPGDIANNKNAHQKKPIEMNPEFPVNLT